MDLTDIPYKFVERWAQSASGSYVRRPPTTTATPGAASYDEGFPPDTFTPIGSGGYAPDGRDMNGILQALSAWAQWQQAGGAVAYDASFSTDIGGYPQGAIVAGVNQPGDRWLNLTDDNTTDPEAGGAGWVPADGAYVCLLMTAASGTGGGLATNNAFAARALVTVQCDPGKLNANGVVTIDGSGNAVLLAGYYRVHAWGSCNAARHKLALYDLTGTAFAAYGTSENNVIAGTGGQGPNWSSSHVYFTIRVTATTTYQIQHYAHALFNGTAASNDFGSPTSDSSIETYGGMEIWRIGS